MTLLMDVIQAWCLVVTILTSCYGYFNFLPTNEFSTSLYTPTVIDYRLSLRQSFPDIIYVKM